ncbi:sigma factor-like helix-turn-helix DNA-binding protein [Brevibacillus thermoruber]|uniref:sigma factor-like helix-turn-helix DNA-binding protein n=1 Tax=Brevibacillus thermoruber TaxID=33942 RepID=UPI000559728A|nr:sigma factor-like helix-turn-helix DNA-binding protein [Brevibacillus thermoruber]
MKRAYEARREGEKVLDNQAITERQFLSEMIGDVEYVIEWLETGRRPGNRRGIERQAAYQRERLMDPIRMQAFVARSTAGSPANLTEWQRHQIEDALCVLSEREKECYVMAYGECFSHSEIAEMLNLSVSSVETYLKRANLKITERTQNSLFLVG